MARSRARFCPQIRHFYFRPWALKHMHKKRIIIHMRTTLNIDEALLRRAAKLSGVKEKTSLVRLGLEALIARESAQRLAGLGGTEKRLTAVHRRRSGRAA